MSAIILILVMGGSILNLWSAWKFRELAYTWRRLRRGFSSATFPYEFAAALFAFFIGVQFLLAAFILLGIHLETMQ